MKKPVRISSAKPTEGFRVLITFTDGSSREIDLEPYLRGPIFEVLRNDLNAFHSIRVDPRMGTVVWRNGADIDPDVLYQGFKPAWTEPREIAAR
jgi:plasmid maintenance system killer protein